MQTISRRVIRMLRRLGYLEAGIEAPVATGYDPLRDHEVAADLGGLRGDARGLRQRPRGVRARCHLDGGLRRRRVHLEHRRRVAGGAQLPSGVTACDR